MRNVDINGGFSTAELPLGKIGVVVPGCGLRCRLTILQIVSAALAAQFIIVRIQILVGIQRHHADPGIGALAQHGAVVSDHIAQRVSSIHFGDIIEPRLMVIVVAPHIHGALRGAGGVHIVAETLNIAHSGFVGLIGRIDLAIANIDGKASGFLIPCGAIDNAALVEVIVIGQRHIDRTLCQSRVVELQAGSAGIRAALPGTQAKGQVADNAVLGHLNASRLGHCIESGIHDSITSSRDRQTLEVTGFINSLVGGIIRGGKAIQIRSRHTLLKRNAVFAGSAQRHFCVVCQRHSGQRENHDQCHQQRQDLCCFLHCSNSFFSKFFCEPRPFHRTPYSFSPVKKRNPLGFRHEALRCKRGLVCGNVTISAPPLLQELLYNLISEHSRSNLVKFQKISVLPNKRFVSHYRP